MKVFRALLAALVLCGQLSAGLHEDIDALFDPEQATHKAVKVDGRWDEPATWMPPEVPTTGARVLLPCNTVTNLHGNTADLQWIRCDGVLKPCDHCDTQLNVHTLYVPMHGKALWGMPDMPCQETAVIEFVPGSAVGLAGDFLPGDWQKDTLGLLCIGEFMACGTDKTAWLEIDAVAAKGATAIVPRDLSYQWMPGDDILIAGTDSLDGIYGEDPVTHRYQSEFRTISSIDGLTINLNSPLTYRHFLWSTGLRYHVANLSRNVIIRSRDPSVTDHRGHMMFMSPMNDIRYARVKGLGRTDKSQPVTDPRKDANGVLVPGSDVNPRRHYADHNHRAGPLNPPSRRMWVVYESEGLETWGIVNHASHGQWDNCIATGFAAGFVTEEGQERGWMRRCLGAMNRGDGDTISSTDNDHGRQSIGDWGTDGAAFWNQSGEVEITDCVAFDNAGRGFAQFTRTLNSFPVYGSPPNPDATVDWIKYPIIHDSTLLDPEYFTLQHNDSPNVPASGVPQQVFDRNTAYGNKVGFQGWSGPTHNASSQQFWPLSIRGSVTNLTLWGRGAKLHLEYQRQHNIEGLRIVGDRGFRQAFNSLSKVSEAVLLRSPEVTVTDWTIEGFDGVAAKFFVEGATDPGGIAGKNLVIEGATINPDGSVN